MTTVTPYRSRPAGRARRLRAAAARGVDQVPDRARLGHRHGGRGAGHRGCSGSLPRRSRQLSATGTGAAVHPLPIGPGRRGGHRQLLLRAPAAGRRRQHHRPGHLADRPDPHRPDRRARQCGPASCRGPRPGSSSRRAPRQGSAYAAMMVTGSHGVRMQYDYTRDDAGLAGAVSAASPALAAADPLRRHDHRLRLRRRHALDPGRHRHPGRPAGDRPGRAVRHLAAVHVTDRRSARQRDRRPHPGHRRLRPRQPDRRAAGQAAVDRQPTAAASGDRGPAAARRVQPGRRQVHRDRLRRHRPGRAGRRGRRRHDRRADPRRARSPG